MTWPRSAPARAGRARGKTRPIDRQRLLTQLIEARRQRCIVVQGPAGSGKTTLMTGWRQALIPLGFEVGWLRLGPEHNDPARLLESLVAELPKGAVAMPAPGPDPDAMERAIVLLAQDLAAHRHEVVLVLDELQELRQAPALALLQWLLDYAPANLHLALVSRSAVPLSLVRLRGQGLVQELGPRELRFSFEETEQYLQATLGDLTRRDVQRLHELTDGWVAGLQLLTHPWTRDRKADTPPFDASTALAYLRNERAFSVYFERAVLSRLTPPERELLMQAAVCDRFCAPLCAAIAGRPGAAVDTVLLLARLEQDNLFVSPLELAGPESWHQLHPMLREVLRQRLATLDAPERQRLHRAAWQWLRERGHLEEAVRQAVLAGEAQAAANLVTAHAARLMAEGQSGSLRRLLGLLPPEQIEASLTLRQWRARMQIRSRDLLGAARSLDRLDQDIPASDAHNRHMADASRVMLALQRDDIDGATDLLPRLLHPPPGADAHLLGTRNNLLSWLHLQRGDYEAARRIQLEAQPLLVDGSVLLGTPAGSLLGKCLLGLSYAMEGRMTLAERAYRDVLHEASRGHRAYAESGYLAAALLGEVLYEINDTEAALHLLEPRVDLLERVSIPDSVWRMMWVLSRAHWLAGRRPQAMAYLERLEHYAERLQLDRLLNFSLGEQLHRHLQLGDFETAEVLLGRAQALYARYEQATQAPPGGVAIAAGHARIRWLLAHGDYESAALVIAPQMTLCEARGRRRMWAGLHLLQATVEAHRGHDVAVREHLLIALRVGQRLGLVRGLLDTGPQVLALIRELARDPSLDPVLGFYVERLLAAAGPPAPDTTSAGAPDAARTAGPTPLEQLSTREREVLQLLAQALPSKRIAKTLGMSYQTVKWHLKNIYGKLGVSSRDQAVARMRDLELPSGPR